jgi:hypothetical protein
VTELAVAAGLTPVLAGRNRATLESMAAPHGLETRVGGLEAADLDRLLDGAAVVVNSVGPYTRFGPPVVAAALRAKAHYLDFTGEPRWVQTMIERYHEPAAAAGSVLVGSVGLGVASGLCAHMCAAALGGKLTHAQIGYRIIGMRPSPATLASTVIMLASGAPLVSDGATRYAPVGSRSERLPGGWGALFPTPDPLLVAHTWPGASAACYMQGPLGRLTGPALAGSGAVLRRPRGRALGEAAAAAWARVPGAHGGGGRATAVVIGEGPDGGRACATARVDDVYEVSARAALHAAQRLLDDDAPASPQTGVRSWSTVTGDPHAAAAAIGAELSGCSPGWR